MIEKLKSLLDSGQLNKFIYDKIKKALPVLDQDMFEEAIDDGKVATELNVDNEDDYRIFHYIDHFAEDLIEEIIGIDLPSVQQNRLKKFMFQLKDKVDYSNLVGFRAAVLKWLKANTEKTVKAYHNTPSSPLNLKMQNMTRWAEVAQYVRKLIAQGTPEQSALIDAASYLHPLEKLDFVAWYKFKFGKNHDLYDLNRKIMEDSEGLMVTKKVRKQALFEENKTRYFLPEYNTPNSSPEEQAPIHSVEQMMEEKEKQEKFNTARSKLVGRTFAIDRLLEKYRDVLSNEQIEELEEALFSLKKKIRMLSRASTINDVFVKTANLFKRNNFHIGAHALNVIRRESFNDPFLQKNAADLDYGELQKILNDLYSISNYLKRRDVVRQLAQIDIKLHDMMISSFFPEINEAQAKLIDSMGYASNKLEDVMPKIRSSIVKPQGEGPPQITPPTGPQGPNQAPSAPAPSLPKPPEPKAPSALEREFGGA